ncbi:MAG: hypothetical protein GH159_04405 [Dehalococcoidia bacterium]|nr:hypothetical protein [Dehalococcoidia bacterium]
MPEEVRKCVLFVGLPTTLPDKRPGLRLKGTAFFVAVPSKSKEGKGYIYLVTAKHVAVKLEGKNFAARLNMRDGSAKRLKGDSARWWYHPTEQSVDVAVIPWVPPPEVDFKLIPLKAFLSDDIIQSEDIGSGDEVFITGLFAHLSGSEKNLPIVRFGNIAMIPDEPVPTSIGMIEAYLIEARSIGGLSGSPVFVYKIAKGRGKLYLMGLMHGHWDIPPENKNDSVITDSFGSVNMGIAIVIPAKKILEVLNHPKLVERRLEGDEISKVS